MAHMRLALLLVGLVCCAPETTARSDGAPPDACEFMKPIHIETQVEVPRGAAPFVLRAPQTAAAGSVVKIGLGGAPFGGFIIRAMNSQGCTYGAQFGAGPQYDPLSCSAPQDSVTHNKKNFTNGVEVQWKTPCAPGTYRIVATVAETFVRFYTGYFADIDIVAPRGAPHACGPNPPAC